MNEEASHGVALVVVDDEHRNDGGISLKLRNKGNILNHSAVIITGNELPGGFKWVSEVGEDETVPREESPVI